MTNDNRGTCQNYEDYEEKKPCYIHKGVIINPGYKKWSREQEEKIMWEYYDTTDSKKTQVLENKIVMQYVGLVQREVNKVMNLHKSKGEIVQIDVQDLFQQGQIALLTALRHYNPEQNCRFVGYARICIQGELYKLIQSELCGYFSGVRGEFERQKKRYRQLEEEGRLDEMDMRVFREIVSVKSLDRPISENSETNLLDFIKDNTNDWEFLETAEVFLYMQKGLSKQEINILRDKISKNLPKKDICQKYHLTQEQLKEKWDKIYIHLKNRYEDSKKA